jgi:hypothetical protein
MALLIAGMLASEMYISVQAKTEYDQGMNPGMQLRLE